MPVQKKQSKVRLMPVFSIVFLEKSNISGNFAARQPQWIVLYINLHNDNNTNNK